MGSFAPEALHRILCNNKGHFAYKSRNFCKPLLASLFIGNLWIVFLILQYPREKCVNFSEYQRNSRPYITNQKFVSNTVMKLYIFSFIHLFSSIGYNVNFSFLKNFPFFLTGLVVFFIVIELTLRQLIIIISIIIIIISNIIYFLRVSIISMV